MGQARWEKQRDVWNNTNSVSIYLLLKESYYILDNSGTWLFSVEDNLLRETMRYVVEAESSYIM